MRVRSPAVRLILLGILCAAVGVSGCRHRSPSPVSRPGELSVSRPDPDAPRTIEARLLGQARLLAAQSDLPLSVTVRFPPRPGVAGDLRLLVKPTWPRSEAGLIRHPPSVLDREGLYLAVTRADGRFVWLARVGDPRFVYAEYESRVPLTGRVFEDAAGVFSTQLPFEPDGTLVLFSVGDRGQVSRVHISEPILGALLRATPSLPGTAGHLWILRNMMMRLFHPLYRVFFYTGNLPAIYRVAGTANPYAAGTVNVLILGDGFVESDPDDDLPSYRAAVERLVKRLVGMPPYCHYVDSLNFYRIDVADIDRGVPPGNCPVNCQGTFPGLVSDPGFTEAFPLAPYMGQGVLSDEFELTRCYESQSDVGECKILWTGPSGQQKIAALMNDYPIQFKIAVLLGNVTEKFGAGWFDTTGAANRLAVLGVPMTTPNVVPPDVADPGGVNLLAHEMGHALGLLDEYPNGSLVDTANAPTTRNIWLPDPEVGPPWPASTAVSHPIPWADLLDSNCPIQNRVACCGLLGGTPADCQRCDAGADPNCAYLPAVCNLDRFTVCQEAASACAPPSVCAPTVAPKPCLHGECNVGISLFEGAFYSYVDRYRATADCRMDREDNEFCDVCLRVIAENISDLGGPDRDPGLIGESCPIWNGSARIVVTDAAGNPIQGARITLATVTGLRVIETDTGGRAILIALPPGLVIVTVAMSGFTPYTFELAVTADGSPIEIVLDALDP